MLNNELKSSIIQGYLNQQLSQTRLTPSAHVPSSSTALQSVEVPSNQVLDEFKVQVRTWLDLDSTIKKLQGALRERRALKKELTEKILAFMARYNIEDLNTKEGKLRYKLVQVKPAITPKTIRERLLEQFSTVKSSEELVKKVFEQVPEQKFERASLRRINVRNAS